MANIEELLEKVTNFNKYARFFYFLVDYWVFGFLFAIGLNFLVIEPLAIFEFFVFSLYTSLGLIFVPWFLITYLLRRKSKKYRPTDKEWAKYYSYSIVNNLEKYSKSRSQGMKEDYRKKALKEARNFLSCIRKRWKIGNFELAKEYFGKPVFELRGSLENIIIHTLKKGNGALLGEIEQLMRNFFWEPLSIESINKLNEGLSKISSTSETISVTFSEQPKFFEQYKIIKHGLVGLALVISCILFFNTVVYYSEIQQEYVFGGTIVLFIGLLTIYFKQKPAN